MLLGSMIIICELFFLEFPTRSRLNGFRDAGGSLWCDQTYIESLLEANFVDLRLLKLVYIPSK